MPQMCIGDDVYTTGPRVTFAVVDPRGGFGQLVVEVAPGESKTVLVNNTQVTVHRPLSTSTKDGHAL